MRQTAADENEKRKGSKMFAQTRTRTRETYTFKIAPDYTIAHYFAGNHHCTLSEWQGRTWADFHAGMQNRGFVHTVEEYELPGRGKFVEHTYTR